MLCHMHIWGVCLNPTDIYHPILPYTPYKIAMILLVCSNHNNKSIRRYINQLGKTNIAPSDFIYLDQRHISMIPLCVYKIVSYDLLSVLTILVTTERESNLSLCFLWILLRATSGCVYSNAVPICSLVSKMSLLIWILYGKSKRIFQRLRLKNSSFQLHLGLPQKTQK